MLDLLGSVLQFVVTWSQFIGLLTAPVAIICLLVAAISKNARSGAAQWAIVLLWPWHLYLWTVGIAICISAFGVMGWLAIIPLLILMVFFRRSSTWFAVLIAVVTRRWDFVLLIVVTSAVLLVLNMMAALLIARANEDRAKAEIGLS